jgi:hypothetical protein
MNNLFLAVLLLTIPIIIVGLIDPNIVVRWGDPEKRTRKKVLLTYLSVMVISFVGFGMTIDKSKVPPAAEKKAQIQQNSVPNSEIVAATAPAPPKAPIHIGMNVDQFKQRFNKASSDSKADLRIGSINIENGEKRNTFQYMFTNSLGVVGAVNKEDGSLNSITMIGGGDGTIKSGANLFMCMAVIIATVNPELQPSERGDILREMGIIGKDDIAKKGETVRNGIKYSHNFSKEMGLWFVASNANE